MAKPSPANSTRGSPGAPHVLIDYSPRAPRVMAEAYRAVLGLTEADCSDAEAIDLLLNPARNPYRLETLNIGVHAPIDARAAARQFHLRQKNQPHRR